MDEKKLLTTAAVMVCILIFVFVFYNLFFRYNLMKNCHSFSTVGEPGEFDVITNIVFINSTNPESINDARLFHFNNKTKELREIEYVVMVNTLPETS